MQQLASRTQPNLPQNNNGASGAPRSQVILIVALLLFSIAGVVSGFSVGAAMIPKKTTNTVQTSTNKPAATMPAISQQTTPVVPKTVDIAAVGVGCPTINISPSYDQVADNTTTYTINTQVVDKSINNKTACGTGKPLLAAGITSKVWLTDNLQSLQDLGTTSLKMIQAPTTLQQGTFPHEATNQLLLNGASQVQDSNANGQVTWKYTLASSVKTGEYFIAVLTDWKGQRLNWSWRKITVTKP